MGTLLVKGGAAFNRSLTMSADVHSCLCMPTQNLPLINTRKHAEDGQHFPEQVVKSTGMRMQGEHSSFALLE
jgi:hypothetical protein